MDAFRSLESPTHHGGFNASMFSPDAAYRNAADRAVKEVFTPRAAPVVPGYRLVFCNFLVKEPLPGDGGVVQIHQDPTFVDEDRYDTIGIWVPLVDTNLENGAIAVIPGSHRWNHGPRGYGGRASPYLGLIPTFLKHSQALPMRAGTALVFSQKVFHGSPANRSRATRISATALLAPNEVPLRCYYPNPKLPGKLEVFEVDDLFYTRYLYGTRPEGVPRVAVVDHWHDAIGPEQLVPLQAALAASRDGEHVVR